MDQGVSSSLCHLSGIGRNFWTVDSICAFVKSLDFVHLSKGPITQPKVIESTPSKSISIPEESVSKKKWLLSLHHCALLLHFQALCALIGIVLTD